MAAAALRDPPHRRVADPDPGAQEMTGDRPGPEVAFRAQCSDLMNQPSYPGVQLVPGRRTHQILGTTLVHQGSLPAADGVGARGRLLGRPASQTHQLEDLGTFFWGVMKTLFSRLVLPMAPEDGELALEKDRV